MRYQKKVFFLIIIFTFILTFGILQIIEKAQKKLLKNYKVEKIEENDISYDLPYFYNSNKPKTYINNGWFIKEYQFKKIGTFRTAVAYGKNPDFKRLSIKYFKLKEYPKSGKTLKIGNNALFFKEIPLFENGAYVVKKRGKILVYIYFFTLHNTLYWFDFSTYSSLTIKKEVFDRILLSIESKNQKRILPKDEFKKRVNSVCRESHYFLCQSTRFFIIIPTLIIIIVLFLIAFIMRIGGKLPDDEFFAGEIPVFKEENIDYQIKFKFNNRISTGAIALTDKNFYLFSFKKPILIFPKTANDYKISTGKSFFGGRYIQFESYNLNYFKSGKFFNKIFSNSKYTIRFFSKDIERLAQLLGIASMSLT